MKDGLSFFSGCFITAILLGLFLLTGCSFHEKVPNLAIETTEGMKAGDRITFLVKYHLYYAPKGIARFPDGGRQ
ncbi:MAG: hypothetical protein KKH98_11520, partial [Spirochaetes bacterium]|nr:hypothetical protein [Spirochaetota bacterium]